MDLLWLIVDTATEEIEIFSKRPETPDIGGDPENWPPQFTLLSGYADGGDTRVELRYTR